MNDVDALMDLDPVIRAQLAPLIIGVHDLYIAAMPGTPASVRVSGKPSSRKPSGDPYAANALAEALGLAQAAGLRISRMANAVQGRMERRDTVRYEVTATLTLLDTIDASANWRE